jgi:pimeloyl-ACP methyl ester carboxylesterase
MQRQLSFLAIGLLGAFASTAQARSFGSLEFEACTLAPEFSTESVEAQCATLSVPENRAAPDGRKIELAIAWVPREGEPSADPVFMLAGGPGQSARDSYPNVAPAFRDVLRQRDVILVDQRGTGGSNALTCKDAAGENAFTAADDQSLEGAARFARECLAELNERADPRFYTTGDAVADLESVRQALGVASINLLGISYGTRVAQQYVMHHPAQARSVILDGVVPNTLVLGSEHAKNLDAALALQFARCGEVAACKDAFGDPKKNFEILAAELRAAPRKVSFRDAVTGEMREEELTYGHLAAVIRLYSYSPMVAAMLPLTLHEAVNGRSDALMAQAQMLMGQLGDQIQHGMQLSVMCAEDAPALKADPADANTVLGTEFVDYSLAQCAVWPRGAVAGDFSTAYAGDTPVLLLSGEFDPVTPPRYGDAVAAAWKGSRHLVLRGQGHNVIGVGCAPKLIARFIDTLDAAELDATCLDSLNYTPPFAGHFGWEP